MPIPVSEFSIRSLTIPSCAVNVALLKRLQTIMRDEGERRNESVRCSLSIQDSKGVEEFLTVDDFKHDRFENDTKDIVLSFRFKPTDSNLHTTLHGRLRFSASQALSTLDMSMEGSDARRQVIAFKDEIFTTLRRTGVINGWFYSRYETWLFILLCLVSSVSGTANIFVLKPADALYGVFASWNAVFTLLVVTYWTLKWLSPYSTIDSPANSQKTTLRNWLFYTFLLSFVVLKLGWPWLSNLLAKPIITFHFSH
jgi:hypothetical protein